MQGLMGSYLERSIHAFHEAQKHFQEQSSSLYGEIPKAQSEAWSQLVQGAQPAANPMGGYLEKGAQAVIDMQEELRRQAFKLFSGFPYANAANENSNPPRPSSRPPKGAAKKPRPAKK